ncbi:MULTISPECIES: hypothetical protein [unclassified Rudaea]|nr:MULTISPECIES: hypothetical protein [unclassified Rudaea]
MMTARKHEVPEELLSSLLANFSRRKLTKHCGALSNDDALIN